jgi:hypothetical protein
MEYGIFSLNSMQDLLLNSICQSPIVEKSSTAKKRSRTDYEEQQSNAHFQSLKKEVKRRRKNKLVEANSPVFSHFYLLSLIIILFICSVLVFFAGQHVTMSQSPKQEIYIAVTIYI